MLELLTLALVLSPWEVPMPTRVPREWFEALIHVSDWLDLTNASEKWRSDYDLEFRWVRYYAHRARSLPPSADAARFPNAHVARQGWEFQRAWMAWHEANQRLFPDPQYRLRQVEMQLRQEAWAALVDAHEKQRPHEKRLALDWLRDTIGVQRYYSGIMPEPVPIEWFWERK